MSRRTYSELIAIESFIDRFKYLQLHGTTFGVTFGNDRHLNQILYSSPEWRRLRSQVILRDNGCDLGCPDRPIVGRAMIHHLNPITIEDVQNRSPVIFDMENLITVSFDTHNAIHFGDTNLLVLDPVERKPFDTVPWRQ